MMRVLLGVVAGYILMAALVLAAQLLMGPAAGTGAATVIPPSFLATSLLFRIIAAVAGGWAAAAIAQRPLAPIGVALLILMMGMASFFAFQESQPRWYTIPAPLLAMAAAYAGGLLRLRRRQHEPERA